MLILGVHMENVWDQICNYTLETSPNKQLQLRGKKDQMNNYTLETTTNKQLHLETRPNNWLGLVVSNV